jgi:FixJ family two-component response regulator
LKESPVVFIVDDDQMVREALARLVKSVGLQAETYPSATEFLEHVRPEQPGCLVLYIRLPGLSGLDLQRRLSTAGVRLPIIFITGHGDIPMTVKAMKRGAADFLQKPVDDQDLLDAIHRAIEQDARLRQEQAELSKIERRIESLTPREREVFALVVAGNLNKQIAMKLEVRFPGPGSPSTVQTHD